MSQKKPRRPRFVPQLILTSTALAGLAVVPAVSLDCGGKTTEFSVGAFVAAAFYDSGSDARSSDAGTFSVGASFEGGFFVAASFDAGSDAPESSVDATSDSGLEPDAPEFVVAANIAPREGDDGSGHG